MQNIWSRFVSIFLNFQDYSNHFVHFGAVYHSHIIIGKTSKNLVHIYFQSIAYRAPSSIETTKPNPTLTALIAILHRSTLHIFFSVHESLNVWAIIRNIWGYFRLLEIIRLVLISLFEKESNIEWHKIWAKTCRYVALTADCSAVTP